MLVTDKRSGKKREPTELTTAEAFYRVFRALPPKERVMAVRYILADDDVRRRFDLPETPNATTLKAFAEDRDSLPTFRSVDELRKDLLS